MRWILDLYLEIFLSDFKLHIVLGEFETTDTLVELVQQVYYFLYSKSTQPSPNDTHTLSTLHYVCNHGYCN